MDKSEQPAKEEAKRPCPVCDGRGVLRAPSSLGGYLFSLCMTCGGTGRTRVTTAEKPK